MTNYQYLNYINAKIISYKYNNQNPIYYVYIGPVFGYTNNTECGIFLKITNKLFSNYQGNEVYELLNTFYNDTWNIDLMDGLENFKLNTDYYLSQSLYNLITRSEISIVEPDYEIGIMPDYMVDGINVNYISYDKSYDGPNNKDMMNIEYFHKRNIITLNSFSQEELDNFYLTFCNIILTNTDFSGIYTENNYIYRSVLEYFRNGSTNEAQSSLYMILGSTFGSSTVNTYSSCGCSTTSSTSNTKSCLDLYKDAMKQYLIKMLGDIEFYKDWFMLSNPEDKGTYNENVVDELIKLIDEFISLEYSLQFEKKMSKCNCEQISDVNNCNKETILKYKEVLNWIKENKIEENTNKIKVYGEAFGELLPNLYF